MEYYALEMLKEAEVGFNQNHSITTAINDRYSQLHELK
jgi:hypothetical protein